MRRNSASLLAFIGMAAVIMVAGYFAWQSHLAQNGTFREGTDLRAITDQNGGEYLDAVGNRVNLGAYKGTPLVVNLWATWTPFSKEELANLSTLATEYSGTVQMLAVNRSEDRTRATSYIEQLGLAEELVILYDTGDVFYDSVGGYAMPETLFYDSEGDIVIHKRGNMSYEEMVKNTEKLLDEDNPRFNK